MWNQFSDIAPKAAVAALALWSGANYFIIAPEVAQRIAKADFLPACEANIRTLTAKAAQQRLADIPPPIPDAGKEATARQLRAMLDNPIIGQLGQLNIPGLSGFSEARTMLRQYEEQKRAAVESYKSAVEKLKQDTATASCAAWIAASMLAGSVGSNETFAKSPSISCANFESCLVFFVSCSSPVILIIVSSRRLNTNYRKRFSQRTPKTR